MQQGDFSELARAYYNRPGYSLQVLDIISQSTPEKRAEMKIADVGAGTGKLTENLLELGFTDIDAVEPNVNMREEGKKYVNSIKVKWHEGSGENTGLNDEQYDWVLMGSSFHWVDFDKGTKEFYRILKPGGKFTAIWNPRNIKNSALHQGIEDEIYRLAPNIVRKSSGASGITEQLSQLLNTSPFFSDCIFIESEYTLHIPKERYIGAWKSTNDIQSQVSADKWKEILQMITDVISDYEVVPVPYKTRAWTAYVNK